ncbi:PQQ-binding-like beta-propeller repeat protein [Pendulispora albinea]|uniref:PQQ-like beta-propeller repeat protein n=1 Tax=Pendulispora albinea TaxID=2741071 RepID=A0ABZ2M7B9_9BACT
MYRTNHAPSPFVLSAVDGTVTAYARASGAIAWTFRVPDGAMEYRHVTRLIADGHRVVIVAARMNEEGMFANADGTAHVCCLDYETGRPLWHQPVKGGQNINRFTATLLIDGDQVFLAHAAVLTAFALETGQVLWVQKIDHVEVYRGVLPVALAVAGAAEQGDI